MLVGGMMDAAGAGSRGCGVGELHPSPVGEPCAAGMRGGKDVGEACAATAGLRATGDACSIRCLWDTTGSVRCRCSAGCRCLGDSHADTAPLTRADVVAAVVVGVCERDVDGVADAAVVLSSLAARPRFIQGMDSCTCFPHGRGRLLARGVAGSAGLGACGCCCLTVKTLAFAASCGGQAAAAPAPGGFTSSPPSGVASHSSPRPAQKVLSLAAMSSLGRKPGAGRASRRHPLPLPERRSIM
mmetsp:Transcript_21352/g.47571  ORF Transcript_21352/g.47571 Transcript_21352/m.47571 type:complete len:242 (-) Transcript_21352:332-1057(-)